MSICILLAVLNQVAPLELEIDSFPYIFTTKLYLESNESWTLDIFMGSKNTELEYTVENEGIWYPVTGERTTIISNGQPTTGEIITLYLKLKSATHSISQLELTFYSNANISIFDEKMCLQANNSIIKITKTQSSGPFYLGDIVSFRYLLKNESDTSIENIIIKDNLPTGIFYVQGTAKLNGTPLPYKTLIPIIESHQEIKLEYSLKITEEAKIGLSFWYTEFSYSGKSDSVLQEIFIEEGVFTKRGIVFGRVTNADGSGIPNTIVRLSNGSISMTDNMGRYHFWGVKDGMHTVFVESDNLSISPKLLWLPKGSVVKADFTPNPQTLEPLNPKTDFLFVALGNMKIEHLLKVPITDNQLIVDSKFAFYFRGKLTGKTIIEAGLDTDRDDMKEIIANIKPNKVYDIYGDKASGGEQQTIGKFYLKLSYSDFNVSYGIGEISLKPLEGSRDEVFAINRPLPYTKVDYSGKVAFTGIGSVQSSTSYKDELRAENKTGPYKLLQPPLIPHSEYISVETRDKNIPDRTINTRIVNSRDYYIDYETGELWFYVPVQSEDIFGNPNFLVIEYLSRLRNPTINHHTILMNLEKKFNYGAIGTKFMKESQVPTDYLLNSVFMRVGKSNGVSTTIEYMLRPGQNEKGIIGKVNIPVKSTTYIGIDYHNYPIGIRNIKSQTPIGEEAMSSRFTTTLHKAVPLYAQYTEAKYITDIPQSMWHSKRGEFSIGINPNLSWQNTLTYSKEKLYANGTVNTADYDKIGITTRVGKVTVFGGVDLCVDNGEKAIINTGSIRYTTGQITTTQRVGFKESKFLYSSSEVGIKTNSTNKLKYEATAAIEKRENMMYIPISNCLYYGSEPLDITLSERVTFIDKGEVTNFTTLGIKTFPVEWIQLGGAIDHLLVGLTTRRVGSNMDVAIRPVTFDKGAVFSSIQVEQEAETQRKYVDQSIDVYLLPHKRIEMLGSYANHYLSAWNKVSYSYLCCCTYNPIAGLLVRGGIENTGNMSAIGYRIGEGIEIFGGYRKRSELLPNYLSPPTSGQSSVFMDISVNKFIRFMNEQASHMLGGATGLNVILQPYTQEKYNVMIEAINDEGRIAQGYNSTCIIYDNTHKLVKEVKFDKKDKGRKELVIDVSPGHLPIVLEDKYKTGVVGASGVLGANYTPIKVKPKEEQKLSEKLSHFKVVVPKEATAGEMFGLKITAINTQGEKMESYMGTVKIVSTNEANVTPSTYQFTVKDQGEAYIWVFYPVAETINIIVIDKKNLTSIGTSGIINIK